MCGISGFCDFSLNYYDKKPFWETILVQMHETLKHRGPDQAMIDLQPHVGLSHARLSIRDLKSGIQPMTRTFHGKTCSIVYNGEIYNHRELLPELQAAGYRFTTTSDTEIILCAYMHFGKNFVEKLNGIFAFAIWDDTNRELLLYRDVPAQSLCFIPRPEAPLFLDQNQKHYFVIRMSLHPLTKTVCRKFWRSVRHAPPETEYSQA